MDGKWDIDNGTGSGTTNWREINSGTATRYIQNANGSDSVRFDDTATGTTTVELTAELTPNDVLVDNTTREYSFTGAGRITGGRGLTKNGPGTLALNSANTYANGTILDSGILEFNALMFRRMNERRLCGRWLQRPHLRIVE